MRLNLRTWDDMVSETNENVASETNGKGASLFPGGLSEQAASAAAELAQAEAPPNARGRYDSILIKNLETDFGFVETDGHGLRVIICITMLLLGAAAMPPLRRLHPRRNPPRVRVPLAKPAEERKVYITSGANKKEEGNGASLFPEGLAERP
jgi:hypothetical protein